MSSHQAVVFDMDGLMIDTERVALECWIESARVFGWEISRETCLSLVGLGQRESRQALLDRMGGKFPLAEVSARGRERYLQRLRGEGVAVKPGLVPLLDWLAERDVPVAVATSTQHALALEKLALAGLRERFETIVCGDQVPKGKPAPDVYREAVARIDADPARCIALEDSEIGLRAAHAAGLTCIVVPDLLPPSPEYEPLAHAIVPSLREARALLDAMLGAGAG
ncbi:MAG TPA: HAD family phosphatase [Burkholderiaceae bacterium]|jgi:HAD superfamily hydrolase (TIGR01509 family)|nr:HAD family phosphatase [Burkholderiaceae bacterium]